MNKITWKWNIPNGLSLVRLALIPAIAITYLMSKQNAGLLYVSVGLLALSGLTDFFDGLIARKLHQITDVGKLLDPLADKLTQVTVVVCLTVRYHDLLPLAILCAAKEGLQAIGGLLMMRRGEKIRGARWYGKVSTVLFYGVMVLLVAFPSMPTAWFVVLVSLVAAAMLFAFVNYLKAYLSICKERKQVAVDGTTNKIA